MFATRGFWINLDGHVVDNGMKWATVLGLQETYRDCGTPIQSLDGVGAESS